MMSAGEGEREIGGSDQPGLEGHPTFRPTER